MACCRSARYFITMQPATTRRCTPRPLRSTTSRIVSIDSYLAASMKPQVLTITTSAASRSFVISTSDSSRSWPSMISLSTRFFGQPREIIPTRVTGFAIVASAVMNSRGTGLPRLVFLPRLQHRAAALVGHDGGEVAVHFCELGARNAEALHAIFAAIVQHVLLDFRLAAVAETGGVDFDRGRQLVDDDARGQCDLDVVDLQR